VVSGCGPAIDYLVTKIPRFAFEVIAHGHHRPNACMFHFVFLVWRQPNGKIELLLRLQAQQQRRGRDRSTLGPLSP